MRRVTAFAIALLLPFVLVACRPHVRGVVTFVGDSNIVFGASSITDLLSNRNNGYLPVFNAHYGAAIRESDCSPTDSECSTTDFWAVRLVETRAKVQTDVFVVELGINDANAPGTATTTGYAAYDGKIDYLMNLMPSNTPVLWTNLPCALEPSSVQDGCATINAALAAAPARSSNLTMLDWASAAAGHPEYMSSNGIHYSATGQRAYATFVVTALDAMISDPDATSTTT